MATAPRAAMAARSAPPWRERTGGAQGGRRQGERGKEEGRAPPEQLCEGGREPGWRRRGRRREEAAAVARASPWGENKREKNENEKKMRC